ncbi:hypothetical protein [Streptomyces bottropensis]|uniref:hypothetical protein n=1 Tax=Streptomyces bottropensis TaxID=42235 RepID=UPI00367E69E7
MADEPLTVDELRLLHRHRGGGRIRTDEHTMTDAEFRALRPGVTDTTEEQK